MSEGDHDPHSAPPTAFHSRLLLRRRHGPLLVGRGPQPSTVAQSVFTGLHARGDDTQVALRQRSTSLVRWSFG